MLAASAAIAAACSGGAAQPPAVAGSTPAPVATGSADQPSAVATGTGPEAAADWPTYHHDAARTGEANGLAPVNRLASAWQAKLGGAEYGQPGVRAAAGHRRPDPRRHRERHRLRAGRGQRAGGVVDVAGHAGTALATALRRHLPARHHRDHGLRPGDPPGVRRRGNHRRRPHAVRPGYRHREGGTQSRGGTAHRRSGGPPAAGRADPPGRLGVHPVRRPGRGLCAVRGRGGGRTHQRDRGHP